MMFAKRVEPTVWKLPVNYDQLTPRQRAEERLEYIAQQEGKCYHCNAYLVDMPSVKMRNKKVHPELFPEHFFEYPVHLHHDHDTGMTIGAVHCHCNAVLWEYHNE